MSEYVTCSLCGKMYVGKIPKGGDGSVLFPRKHYYFIPQVNALGITILPSKKVICEGSYQEAKEYEFHAT